MIRNLYLIILALCANAISVAAYDFVVATDGSGDFKTVQEAINAVPDFRKVRTTVFIKKGTYKEKLVLAASKNNVAFIGEDLEKTILTYDDYASKKNRFGEEKGTTGSTSFYIFGDNFTAENITFENSAGAVGQAVAVRIDGDEVAFKKCRFLGFQDTLYPHGKQSRQYYKNCYIEGTVDFIFGWSTAVFDQCTIHCKGSGYITAPATEEETTYGFVFKNCKITGEKTEPTHYLGRPWRPYGKSVFVACDLGAHIKPEGWNNWRDPNKEKTAFFAEYNCTGPSAKTDNRVTWAKQLTKEEGEKYTLKTILGEWVMSTDLFSTDNE